MRSKAFLMFTKVLALTSLIAGGSSAASGAGAAPPSRPAASDAVARATGAALQGDVAAALNILASRSEEVIGPADQKFASCMRARFAIASARDIQATGGLRSDLNEILIAYREYWHAALTRPASRGASEARLAARLATLLAAPGENLDQLEPRIQSRFAGAGVHVLLGQTGVLRELMIWKRITERNYDVALPGGRHTTHVKLLDEFVSLGWGDYATCGRRGAGGWATPAGLYAVVPRYASLEGEEFRVTFLGHETQHYADLERYPGMPAWRMEYRAKLVELAQAVTTRPKILGKFTEDQGDDTDSPHSYANRCVLRALAARLQMSPGGNVASGNVADVQRAATEALSADTALLARPDARSEAIKEQRCGAT